MRLAEPVTTLNMPAGTSAFSTMDAKATALNGVALAGLATTPHPQPSAAGTFFAIMPMGKFHGVIDATTPAGRWWTSH